MQIIYLILTGIMAGLFSGFLGLGGGVIIIPAFIYIFGMNQHLAQGTSLALMVPPITFIAAWRYFKHGNVDVTSAFFVCLGFILGGFFGAEWSQFVSDIILKKVFGFILLVFGVKMMFF